MVRPAPGPRTGPIETRGEETPAAPETKTTTGGEGVVDGTTTTPDPDAAATAEAKARLDPIAQQQQLKITAKLDRKVDPETAVKLVKVGHRAAHAVYENGSALAQHAAEALQGASSLSGTGRVVTHGTITKQGNRFVYSPEPRDKLVVPSEEGGTRTFTFDKIEGDLSSFQAFFGGNHHFSFRVDESGENGDRLRVETAKQGENHTVRVRGSMPFEGQRYDVDVKYEGRERRQSDSTGSSYNSTATYSGTVSGNGVELTVRETQRFNQVHAVRTQGLGGTAVSTQREINNRLRTGEDTYEWRGVRINSSFRDGRASNAEREWSAHGELLLNGTKLGSYALGLQPDAVCFELDIGGERQQIQSFERYRR